MEHYEFLPIYDVNLMVYTHLFYSGFNKIKDRKD